jgi:hypothetical protein
MVEGVRGSEKLAACCLRGARWGILLVLLLCLPPPAAGGPPYVTDDPEPVDYLHWEVYLATLFAADGEGWSGTAPHVEVNFGAAPNLQLHVIAPLMLDAPEHGHWHYGYGDTELGAKYRFVEESTWRPQVGTFPLVEVPTAYPDRDLGAGHVQLFMPLWLQKSVGPWTTYGGGGYWINPGAGNHDWLFIGWLLQRQVTDQLSLGAEIFHDTVSEVGGAADTRFNVGMVFDLSQLQHVLLSAGRGIVGSDQFQGYLAYQLTFGPGGPGD